MVRGSQKVANCGFSEISAPTDCACRAALGISANEFRAYQPGGLIIRFASLDFLVGSQT